MLRLPIMARPLRGYWWLPASRGKVLRILGGAYEPEQTALFLHWVRPGTTVIDIGAHVGYYTLLASILAGDSGAVWAFEPEPKNAAFLRRHMYLNHRRNVHIEELAVSDSAGVAPFRLGRGSGTGHLETTNGRSSADSSIEVRTVRLSEFCTARGIRPDALKIDVEGAELAVLDGARETIASARPVIFLSTHGPDVHSRCLAWLRDAGYTVRPIIGHDVEHTAEILCIPDGAVA